MHVCVCLCLRGDAVGIHRSQKRVLDHLELEIQVVGRHTTWILESEFLASTKRVHTTDHCVISIVPLICNLQHL